MLEEKEQEINRFREDIDSLRRDTSEMQDTLDANNKLLEAKENALKEQHALAEKVQKTADIMILKYEKCKAEFNEFNAEFEELKEKHAQQSRYFKVFYFNV